MADYDPVVVPQPNPNPAPAPATEPSVDVEDLKAFMGDAYKEGMTLADVSAFLKGKKYADLNSGNYVAKRKYDDLEKKHNEHIEATKDYETIKTENATYKEAEHKAELRKQAAAAKIDEQFIDYALSQIDPKADDTQKALKEWIKANPQFKMEDRRVFIETSPSHERGSQPFKNPNQVVNDRLRAAAGKNNN